MRRAIGIIMMIVGFTTAVVNPLVMLIAIPVGVVGVILFIWGFVKRSSGRTYE